MTGQDLLNRMQVLDNELLLQPGEADVARGLLALNMAQQMFESLIATKPGVLGNAVGTIAVINATPTSAWPSGLLRLDALWMLDAATSRPAYRLSYISQAGGVAPTRAGMFPVTTRSDRVTGYWDNGTSFYWFPLPSQSDTIRYYGFAPASAITVNGTFAYPDIVALPLVGFAVKLMKMGVGDDSLDLNAAIGVFGQVVETLSRHNRDRAPGFDYTYSHST